MRPDECRVKRNELLAQARAAERLGTFDGKCVAERCRTMAQNLDLMASNDLNDQERGRAMYDKNRADFEKFISAQS